MMHGVAAYVAHFNSVAYNGLFHFKPSLSSKQLEQNLVVKSNNLSEVFDQNQ